MDRRLTITAGNEERTAIKACFETAVAEGVYRGEYMNFAAPALFFSRLNGNRWRILQSLIGAPEIGVQELAKGLGRGVRGGQDDTAVLIELGLIEGTEAGKLICPFVEIHVDMRIRRSA
jgi:hypothetical protein